MLDTRLIVCDIPQVTIFRADEFRAARAKAGLTQQQVADKAGVQRETVTHAENGDHQPTMATLLKLAKAVDVPFETLVEEATT